MPWRNILKSQVPIGLVGNSKETILLRRRIAAQRIVIDAIHLLNKYELHKIDSEMPTLIDGALFKSSIS